MGLFEGVLSIFHFTNSIDINVSISCQYIEVQEQLATLLCLPGTNSRIPVTSIAAFVANTGTETAYKQFCNDLYEVGVTEDMARQNKDEILEILKSQGMVASTQVGCSDIRDKHALETAYHEYCKDLYRIGFTEDLIPPKARILAILRSRGMVASSNTGGSNTRDKGQLLE